MSKKYITTIGLEVHVELNTKSKMFCGCKNDPHAAEANSLTCPICLAHPGTLPVANTEAIAKVMMFGELSERHELATQNLIGKIIFILTFQRVTRFHSINILLCQVVVWQALP